MTSSTSRRAQPSAPPAPAVASRRGWIVFLCWLTVVFEGFDIVAFGASIPTLLDSKHLGMTAADATLIATVSLVGVGLGAGLIGPLSDRFGRRRPLILCVLLFSVFTLLVPLMPSVALLAAVRLIAGLGLGGCMPVAVTAMQEASPNGGKAHSSTLTMTGYHVGAVLASLIALIAGRHWEWMFYGGGVLGLLMLPLMLARLPETSALRGGAKHGSQKVARASTGREDRPSGMSVVFQDGRLRTTLMLWVAAFMGLLLVYGLNTWLPQLMRGAGYPVADSLVMLLVLNVGAIAGLLVGGRIADRRGPKGTTIVWFAAAAVLLALLSVRIESQLLLNALVFVTGVFVFCAQVLIYGFVGYLYPSSSVGTAMGLVSAVGRLGAIVGPWITGALVTAGIAYPLGFYVFAGAAALGAGAVALIRRPQR